MTNTDLFKQYQAARGTEKESDTLDAIYEQYKGLIYMVATRTLKKIKGNWLEKDDLISNLHIEFIKSVRNYKPQLGFQFSTYAVTSMQNYVYRMAYTYFRFPVHRPVEELQAYQKKFKQSDRMERLSTKDKPDLDTLIDAKDFARKLPEILNSREIMILTSLYGNNVKTTEVVKTLKVTRSRVHQIKEAALNKIYEHFPLGDEYGNTRV